MPNYIQNQKYDWDCGVIAVINSKKWLGGNIGIKQFDEVRCQIDCDEDGTDPAALYLQYGSRQAVNKQNPTWNFVKEWCQDDDKSAIISFKDQDDIDHLAFYDGEQCPNHSLGKDWQKKLPKKFNKNEYCLLLVR